MPHTDDHYELAKRDFRAAKEAMGSADDMANPQWHLMNGLTNLVEGLLRRDHYTGLQIDEILKILRPPK